MAKGYTLLRLKPGPAEAEFGITAAPMSVIADWYGRVVVRRLSLRGDIRSACSTLTAALKSFDRRAASKPPYEIPRWAEPFFKKNGAEALARFLAGKKRKFSDLTKLFRSLEREGEIIALANAYIDACEKRAPAYGKSWPGQEEEVDLLAELTWHRNDKVKFRAIDGYAKFAPVGNVDFFVRRAEEKGKDALNPNVVLCRCVEAVGTMAGRFPGAKDRQSVKDREAILAALPLLTGVLETEGRNNGACGLARKSIVTVLEVTESPLALGAYIETFNPPAAGNDWLRDYTAKDHQRSLKWITAATGEDYGTDYRAWATWYRKNEKALVWSKKAGRFRVDAKAAKAYRARLKKAAKKK